MGCYTVASSGSNFFLIVKSDFKNIEKIYLMQIRRFTFLNQKLVNGDFLFLIGRYGLYYTTSKQIEYLRCPGYEGFFPTAD